MDQQDNEVAHPGIVSTLKSRRIQANLAIRHGQADITYRFQILPVVKTLSRVVSDSNRRMIYKFAMDAIAGYEAMKIYARVKSAG
jgi:hypothetical protein